MGIRVLCCSYENVVSYTCGYSHWNTLKNQIVESTQHYIQSCSQSDEVFYSDLQNIKKELVDNHDVILFLKIASKYMKLLEHLNLEGIYTFIYSSDSDHEFTYENSMAIEKSIQIVSPYISLYKSDIIDMLAVFHESGVTRNPVIIQ